MKKSTIVVICVAVLFSFALGYRVKDKIEKRSSILATPGAGKLPDALKGPQLKQRDIYFLVREKNAGTIMEADKREELEKLLSLGYVKFHFRIGGRTPDDKKRIGGNESPPNMGMIDALRAEELVQQGLIEMPFYAASPKEQECVSETQIVSNGSVHTIEGLAGKTIGIDQTEINLALGLFKKLRAQGITVKKLVIYKRPAKALGDLSSGAIDAYFDRVSLFPSGEVISRLTANSKGVYVGYPNFQVLLSTANKIPCKVIFISSKISKETREIMKGKFTDVFNNPKTKDIARSGLDIGSLQVMTPEIWKRVEDYYKQNSSFQIKTFAEDIVYN